MAPTSPLRPSQVAAIFGVSVVTVGAWADDGKLASFRTPGGQRRFRPEDVAEFLAAHSTPGPAEPVEAGA